MTGSNIPLSSICNPSSPSSAKAKHKQHSSEPASEYEKWVARLYNTPFFHPINNGLMNISILYDLMGSPLDDPDIAVIHIAGTNGKGSVGLKIANTLQLLGYRVGLYSSPHVSCFRERIQMNGELISEEEVAEYLPQIYKLCCDHGIPGTFFEITTALAFLFFQKQHEAAGKRSGSNSNSNNETVVVLEAGLGGRLDATNVIPSPVLSIITSVGLDHTKILGNTREEIAIEKAGIFRADTPVIVGSRVPLSTLKQYAREKRIASFQTSHEIMGMIDESDQKEILDYDEENSRTAKAAIAVLQQSTRLDLPTEIPTAILEKGTRVRPPCRFEIIENVRQRGNMVVLDVAHNPSAMESLVWKLRHNYMGTNNTTGIRFLVGMSKDKDWRGILEHLWPLVESKCCSKIHLAEAAHGKASPLDELVPDILSLSKTETRGCNVKHIFDYDIVDPSVTAALDRAMKSMPDGELLVVCGSIFLMIEARQVLGIVEPRDSEYLIDTLAGKLPATKAFANNEIHA